MEIIFFKAFHNNNNHVLRDKIEINPLFQNGVKIIYTTIVNNNVFVFIII